MTDESTPGGSGDQVGERPEHDSVNPALEDEPSDDEAGADEAAQPLAGDDELASGQYGPGTPQAGT